MEVTTRENIFVITNEQYKFHCMNQADIEEANIIVEPTARNTLGAIILGIESGKDNDRFLVLSSDHVMEKGLKFARSVMGAVDAAKDSIVVFGVKPTMPNTGY